MSLPKHDGQVYYEHGRAWTPERTKQSKFVWKRVPEKDARLETGASCYVAVGSFKDTDAVDDD